MTTTPVEIAADGSMTPYQLSKLAGTRPQHMYNLVRQGTIEAIESTCETCGRTAKRVPKDEADRYLEARAERLANKAEREAAAAEQEASETESVA